MPKQRNARIIWGFQIYVESIWTNTYGREETVNSFLAKVLSHSFVIENRPGNFTINVEKGRKEKQNSFIMSGGGRKAI